MKDKSIEMILLTQEDLIKSGCFNIPEAIKITEQAFQARANNDVIFPDKVSVIFDEQSQNRINCLPAGSYSENVYGMKWVSVFPNNPKNFGFQNVSAVILLSNLVDGFPIAFMEGTLCSNLRTAAASAIAAKYLARNNVETIGFIGAGEQAKTHFMTMMSVRPTIKTCKIASRTYESELKFIEQLSKIYPDITFIPCKSTYQSAVKDADIIITAISGQEMILQSEWIKEGALYCHVGGLEDAYSVPLMASKIVCDDWEVVKHRTQTISRMYKENLLSDNNIYCNLHQLVSGEFQGRENEKEFIYFNTVGMSFVDVILANHMYKKAIQHGYGNKVVLQSNDIFSIDKTYITI